MYHVIKTYGSNLGLSCAFRQWKATHSHCQYLHGYALEFQLTFASENLDQYNWVIDYGGLDDIHKILVELFDHKVLVSHDDPELSCLQLMEKKGIMKITLVEETGCEYLAKLVYQKVKVWLKNLNYKCEIIKVEIREHGANASAYIPSTTNI